MPKKISITEIISKFKQVHGDRYDYSLVKYTGSEYKVKIVCQIHGVFEQIPKNHIKGQGCPECGGTNKLITDTFITKARQVHGDRYDYSLVEYINNKTKVTIICPEHGLFEQRPDNHLWYFGCRSCGVKNCGNKNNKLYMERLTIEEDPIESDGEIQCRCAYCRSYFNPSRTQIIARTKALIGKHQKGESRLYCSNKCKQLCPIFGKSKHQESANQNNYRADQYSLKRLTHERDDNTCQRCGSTEDLHCHHITGVEINPIESADIDNCITLCYTCHMRVHNKKGCKFFDFRKKECV